MGPFVLGRAAPIVAVSSSSISSWSASRDGPDHTAQQVLDPLTGLASEHLGQG
jgi:hypothetical protein